MDPEVEAIYIHIIYDCDYNIADIVRDKPQDLLEWAEKLQQYYLNAHR